MVLVQVADEHLVEVVVGETNAELVELQLHKNDWHVRHARRLLAERAEAGQSMEEVHQSLRKIFETNPDVTRKLRAMWALHNTGGTSTHWLSKQLDHKKEHVRVWAIRLLCDHSTPNASTIKKFRQMAKDDSSGLVRVYLASALQRTPLIERLSIAERLAQHDQDANDRVQPLMIWYGIEPAVVKQPSEALELALHSRIPKLRRFVARRLAEHDPNALQITLAALAKAKTPDVQADFLGGLRRGLLGYKTVRMPKNWATLYAKLKNSTAADVRESAHFLAVLFNDKEAIVRLRKTLADRTVSTGRREVALQALLKRKNDELFDLLGKLAHDRKIRGPVLRALAAFDKNKVSTIIIGQYKSMTDDEKQDAIATLASRPKYALALLGAIERKDIPRQDVSTFTARQLQELRDKRVSAKLAKVWGQVRRTPAKRQALIENYKGKLTESVMAQANLTSGKAVFKKMCMQCHRLYGEGNKIGPDLTGSNRNNLHYVLENLIDPSATIGRDYRLTNVFTANGRLIAGIVVEENEQAVTLQTTNERLVVPKKDIEARRVANVSMMPEGQIEKLKFDELRDLIGYLRRKK